MHTLKDPQPTSKPTGSTTYHLTTLIHPQSYNTHTLKGPPTPTPNPQEVPPTILQHSYTKGIPPPPTLNPQEVPPTILQHSFTKGTPHPDPLPPTHHLTTHIHPQSYNTHTLKGPPPPTILQHSYTHNLTTFIH